MPWRIWRVTHWTRISCPACQAQLGRGFDLQLAGMCILGALLPFLALVVPGPGLVKLIALFLFLGGFWALDAYTVKLKLHEGKA